MAVAPGPAATTAEGLAWPEGDPGALRASSGQTMAIADGVREASGFLADAGAGSTGWQGTAAEAFRATIQAQRALMDRAEASLTEADAALRDLARQLDEAQDRIRVLDREVREAEEEADRAEARAAVAAAAAATAGFALDLAGPDPPVALRDAATAAGDQASATRGTATDARSRATEVRRSAEREAEGLCEDVARADLATSAAVDAAAEAVPLAGHLPGAPTPATSFAARTFAEVPVERWREYAYHRAGIDGDAWDPARGLARNDAAIRAGYERYGELFRQNPEEFRWAGMANMVAPTFYAAFQDFHTARTAGEAIDLSRYVRRAVIGDIPGPVDEWAEDIDPIPNLGRVGAAEAGFYEDRFLHMQKEIFDDLVWQHEAYALGGAPLMGALADRGTLPRESALAWDKIAHGDPAGGNRDLLYREQNTIIQDDYDAVREHSPSGGMVTTAMTQLGENPIPGGQAYRDFSGRDVHIPLPGHDPAIPWVGRVDVPLMPEPPKVRIAEGNIADFDDRWAWIEGDMLPAYEQLLRRPGTVEAVTREDLGARAEDLRFVPLPYDPPK